MDSGLKKLSFIVFALGSVGLLVLCKLVSSRKIEYALFFAISYICLVVVISIILWTLGEILAKLDDINGEGRETSEKQISTTDKTPLGRAKG